jgi:hypothetical protein
VTTAPPPPETDLRLKDYRPEPQLVTPETSVLTPRFNVVDAHNHLGETFGGGCINRPVSELLDVLDEAGVQTLVDLDGGWGEEVLHRHLDHFKAAAPERFVLCWLKMHIRSKKCVEQSV